MEIKLTLALPRDELSVAVARRVLRQAMDVLGVDEEVTTDIQLALTEAVTNVLDHAGDSDEYEVSAGIANDVCVIEVIDRGSGFDASSLGHAQAEDTAEEGRGLHIMRALVDMVQFDSREHVGNVVHLEKRLRYADDAVIKVLTEGNAPTVRGPWTGGERSRDSPDPR